MRLWRFLDRIFYSLRDYFVPYWVCYYSTRCLRWSISHNAVVNSHTLTEMFYIKKLFSWYTDKTVFFFLVARIHYLAQNIYFFYAGSKNICSRGKKPCNLEKIKYFVTVSRNYFFCIRNHFCGRCSRWILIPRDSSFLALIYIFSCWIIVFRLLKIDLKSKHYFWRSIIRLSNMLRLARLG